MRSMIKRKPKIKEKLAKKEERLIKWELSHLDKVFLVVVGSIGFIFFWKGTLDIIKSISIFNDPWVSILAGLMIMLLTGWVIRSGALRTKD